MSDQWREDVKKDSSLSGEFTQQTMAFGSYVSSSSFKERGFEVFDHNMNFDEGKILRDHAEKIKKEMQID